MNRISTALHGDSGEATTMSDHEGETNSHLTKTANYSNRHELWMCHKRQQKLGNSGNRYGKIIPLWPYLDQQDESYQKPTFLCTIGEEALEIFSVFEFSASKNQNKVSTIIQKIDKYFAGDIIETYERYKFNHRQQSEGESYLTELKSHRKTTATSIDQNSRNYSMPSTLETGTNLIQT